MRLVRLLVASAVVLFLSPAFAPMPVAAQQAPAQTLPCKGTLNIVRVSDIKPGMMEKFLQAAAAQQAWYKAAGAPDTIGVMRVMVQDPATNSWSTSETQAITTHTSTGPVTATHDAAWDAFVAAFKDTSTIKTQYMTCVAM